MKVSLIAVQLEIDAAVLATADRYRAHIDEMVACAVEEAGDVDARLVVLPEIAGHLGLLALAPPPAHKRRSLGEALAMAAVRRPLEVLRGFSTTRLLQPRHAVLAALAPDGERYWRSVMGPLARRHDAYVVAGSHLRLGPEGDLTNASFLFAPDGRCIATTDKVNLVPGREDGAPGGLGLARGEAEHLPIVATPLGTVATLIGYDAFAAPHTELERFVPLGASLRARGGVAIAANPAALDEGVGLAASLREVAFARFGVTAQLVGNVLDLQFSGTSQIVARDTDGVHELARTGSTAHGGHVVAAVTC